MGIILSVIFIAVRQNFAIHGDGVGTIDVGQGLIRIVVQGDIDINVNRSTHYGELHEHVTIVLVLNALLGHLAFVGASTEAIDTGIAHIESILEDAIFGLNQNEIGVTIDGIVAIARTAKLNKVGDKNKVATTHRVGCLSISHIVI